MIYGRVYADENGESHFEELEAIFSPVDYVPPAPPFFASPFSPAGQYGMLRIPAGWYGDWHPVSSRQMQIFVEGELEAQFSDGEIRRVGPGSVYLVEDTTGKGHKSWVVGDKDVVIFVVRLPEEGIP